MTTSLSKSEIALIRKKINYFEGHVGFKTAKPVPGSFDNEWEPNQLVFENDSFKVIFLKRNYRYFCTFYDYEVQTKDGRRLRFNHQTTTTGCSVWFDIKEIEPKEEKHDE